ncbi:hypothetical protein AYO38_11865, partial [bacterium SCGC AG-212-C10]
MNRPFYARIALIGVAMWLSFLGLIFITTAILGPSELYYPLIMIAIVLTIGSLIYFVQPWGLVAGILAGLVSIPFCLDEFAQNISAPDSFFNFAYRPIVWAAGAILVLAGSSCGLVQHFRKRTGLTGSLAAWRAAKGIVVAAAVISMASLVITIAGIDRVSAADKHGATQIRAKVLRYKNSDVTASSSGDTKLVIKNEDTIIHTFTVDALDIDIEIGPFSERLVVLHTPQPGVYGFRCTITGHEK